MKRTEHLVESEAAVIQLTDSEAAALTIVGTQLASDRTWWGDTDQPIERSVVQCLTLGQGRWSVRVRDAIGVVSLGEVQLVVSPKIPMDHLALLFSESIQVPRLADQSGWAGIAASMWELVARWFVRSAEAVLRRDLARDYYEHFESLRAVRGRVEHFRTARAFSVGRLDVHCVFDEFSIDTPLNRLIKAAARETSASVWLHPVVRRDAARLVARMSDVGDIAASDMLAAPERRTAHYRDAVTLAKQVLRSVGRTVSAGDAKVWTFLIRTPELVEAGVRNLLRRAISPITVTKKGQRLAGSLLTVNPDLVFGNPDAVGDVKYKLATEHWSRADLYEVVAFAEEFKTRRAALLVFGRSASAEPRLRVGDIGVERIGWDITVPPMVAGERLCAEVRQWLTG